MTDIQYSVHSKPFWDGVQSDKLLLPFCVACDKAHFPPRPFCPHCWAEEIEWRAGSGRGTLYTFTIVRANPPSAFVDILPFVIGIVRLEEDVQMMTHVVGDHDKLYCDAPVEVEWIEVHNRKMPGFRVLDQ
jgi:hypothetical protein